MGPAGTHSSAQNISQKSIKKHARSAAASASAWAWASASASGAASGSGAADGERERERERLRGQSAGDKCPKASKRNVDKAGAALGQATEDGL